MWIAASILLIGAAAAFFFRGWLLESVSDAAAVADMGNARHTAMPVLAVPVKMVDSIAQQREYTGVVRAGREANLGFEMTGRVEAVLVDEGDKVVAEQDLALLDTRTLIARRDATTASLNQAKAVLAELNAGPRQELIDSTRAQLQEAESALEIARLNLDRREGLRENGAVSTEEYQQALYSFRGAKSRARSIERQLDELIAGTRSEQIKAQAAAVTQLQAALAEIEVQIEKSTLVAPFPGRIIRRRVDPGVIISPAQTVLQLVEIENLEAVIGLPADVAGDLVSGQSLMIRVDGTAYAATVSAKIQQLEPTTRTRKVIFKFDASASDRVLPGQLCTVSLATEVSAAGFWLRTSALTRSVRGLWSVMIVDDSGQRAVRRDVEVVYTDGDRVLVRGTLGDGDRVIVEGSHRIVEGQRIDPVSERLARGDAELERYP